ncbi:amino acid kinase [Candidatus Micrarchaeota archaeon]|nr:MAG: amino acid kinase [Candidatus Micrarchaeota archaeon]
MNNLAILKIGGSVITDKHSETPKVNLEVLHRIASEIAEAYDKDSMSLILIHGAGSYGHQIVKKTGIHKGINNYEQLLAFAETQRLQNELNSIVTKVLIEKGLPAIPVLASSHAVMEAGRLVKMDVETIKGFLSIGLIPVLYGVPAYDRKQKCSILSGDQIAPFLAEKLNARKIIHGTNVDGIFTANPKEEPNARLIPEINSENFDEIKRMLGGSSAVDVTGGMFGKVMEIIELLKKGVNVEAVVINAEKEGNIKDALRGEIKRGTVIRLR